MGGAVGKFFVDVGKTAAKAVTSHVLGKVPIIGNAAADWINSKYKRGGQVRRFADGGFVHPDAQGLPTKEINTPAQLIATIKQFPEEAKKAGLTIAMVKDAAKEGMGKSVSTPIQEQEDAPAMKRGGKKHRQVKHHHEEEEEDEEMMEAHAHGGVISLPLSNLDRLDRHSSGGVHLLPGEGEHSYVQLHHGSLHADRHHQRHHHKKFVA
jgi:hypothetical protein